MNNSLLFNAILQRLFTVLHLFLFMFGLNKSFPFPFPLCRLIRPDLFALTDKWQAHSATLTGHGRLLRASVVLFTGRTWFWDWTVELLGGKKRGCDESDRSPATSSLVFIRFISLTCRHLSSWKFCWINFVLDGSSGAIKWRRAPSRPPHHPRLLTPTSVGWHLLCLSCGAAK